MPNPMKMRATSWPTLDAMRVERSTSPVFHQMTARHREHHLDGWVSFGGHGFQLLYCPLRINLVWFLHVATLLFFAKKFPQGYQGNESRYLLRISTN